MLHGIINEQGHKLNVRFNISGKINIFCMLSYKSLASGAYISGINSLVIIKHLYLCYRCYK